MTSVIKIAVIFFVADVAQSVNYTTKWDDVDVNGILHSERLLKNYKNCIMDKGSCTPDGKELKSSLPDALKNDCKGCSKKQKEKTEMVVNFIIEHKPRWWEEMQKKYDPAGIYYERFLRKKKAVKAKAAEGLIKN